MELVDSHAHIGFQEFDSDRVEVLTRSKAADVAIVDCSLSPEELNKILPLRADFPNLYLTIGCTPYELEPSYFYKQFKLMELHAKDIVAIGEIGLDYHHVTDKYEQERERKNFLMLLSHAKELDKPVVIHSRDAEEVCLDILARENIPHAIMHCYSGPLDVAQKAVAMGYLISIPTNLAKSKQKKKLVSEIPLENLVLETDSPYLSPDKERNEPTNIRRTAELIAEIKEISFEEVASQTTKNASNFFGF